MIVEHEFIDDGDVVVARLQGELDLSNVPALTAELRDAVAPDRAGMCLDLSGVRYMDSTGIRMLFAVAGELAVRRQRCAIVLPEDSPLARLLAITDLGQAATIYPAVEDCLAAWKDPARGKSG